MNIYQFMSESPILTFVILYITANTLFKMWNRLMHHLNIRAHGWPPLHCDADGDLKEEPETETTEDEPTTR